MYVTDFLIALLERGIAAGSMRSAAHLGARAGCGSLWLQLPVAAGCGKPVAAMACGRWWWKALAVGAMLPRALLFSGTAMLTGPEKRTTADQVLSFIVQSSTSPRACLSAILTASLERPKLNCMRDLHTRT